jgi:hypothetical protein
VPFLGAGVNVSSDEYKGLPLANEVTLRLVEELIEESKGVDPKDLCPTKPHKCLAQYKDLTRIGLQDLARVALHVQFKGDTPYLMDLLKTILPDEEREPSKLLTTLAQLPFELIVTTNYDRLTERALALQGKSYKMVVQPIKGFGELAWHTLENELAVYDGLVVYKIHGTFLDKSPSNKKQDMDALSRVIITEEDYIEFLTVIGEPFRGIPGQIKSKMKTSTLLLLGYSLEDWDFRTIFKGLIETLSQHGQLKSFAIQKDPSDFWVKFWEDKGVVIYNVDLYEFAAELEKRYREYVARRGTNGR